MKADYNGQPTARSKRRMRTDLGEPKGARRTVGAELGDSAD
jgi:hypothetical protein